MSRLVGMVGIASAALVLGVGSASAALRPGEILVADFELDALIRVDPVTGKQSRFGGNELAVNSANPLLATPTDVMISPTGRIFVVDFAAFTGGDGGVIEIDPDTGEQTKISADDQPVNASSQLFAQPNGIAMTRTGKLLVTNRGGAGTVVSVDSVTGKETLLSSNDQPVNASSQFFGDLRGGITVTRSGAVLVGNSSGGDAIVSIDPITGKQTRLSANTQPVNSSSQFFEIPVGVKETASGQLVVADQGVGVIGVNPTTGKQTKVSANDQPVNSSSQFFSSPFHLAFALNGRILVADIHAFGPAGCGDIEGCGGVISVDPATGKQKELSSNNLPVNATSQLYTAASGIAVMPPRCQGRLATVYGTPGRDKIRGTVGPDVIAAQAGRDTISGLKGKDIVCAGAGNDTVRGGSGNDRIRGNAGRDRLIGGRGRDRLLGGVGRDILRGGPGRDRQKQ